MRPKTKAKSTKIKLATNSVWNPATCTCTQPIAHNVNKPVEKPARRVNWIIKVLPSPLGTSQKPSSAHTQACMGQSNLRTPCRTCNQFSAADSVWIPIYPATCTCTQREQTAPAIDTHTHTHSGFTGLCVIVLISCTHTKQGNHSSPNTRVDGSGRLSRYRYDRVILHTPQRRGYCTQPPTHYVYL